MPSHISRRDMVGSVAVGALVLSEAAAAADIDAAPAAKTGASVVTATASPPGAGGEPAELHQAAGGGHPDLTTNQGMVVADDQNSLRAGARGPVLLEDFVLREKITHFDHERIPERIVHARGFGGPWLF